MSQLGKFSSDRDSALHFLCSAAEWSNGSFGDVEAPTGFVWKISNYDFDVADANNEFGSVIEGWFEEQGDVTDSPEFRASLVGYFLLTEDSNGFVHVLQFETREDLDTIFSKLEVEFEKWDSQDDEDAPTMGDYFS